MARILLVLAVLLLLLNGMTFLLVVSQGNGPEKMTSVVPVTAQKLATGTDPQTQKLELISQHVQSLQKSISELTRKVDDLQRKTQLSAARAISATAPAAAPSPATARDKPQSIPKVRSGPTETSAARAGEAKQQTPELEGGVEDDNAADHVSARRVIGAPAGQPAPISQGSENGAEAGGTREQAPPTEGGGTAGGPAEGAPPPTE